MVGITLQVFFYLPHFRTSSNVYFILLNAHYRVKLVFFTSLFLIFNEIRLYPCAHSTFANSIFSKMVAES